MISDKNIVPAEQVNFLEPIRNGYTVAMYRFFFGLVVLITVVGLASFAFQTFSQNDILSKYVFHTDNVSGTTDLGSNETTVSTLSSTTLNTKIASSSSVRVPIAVYHGIRDTSPEEPLDVRQFNISPAIFNEQLRYLYENDFHTITFAMLHDAIVNGTPLPSKPVILSFDDGWRTQYLNALPILKKYDFTATFFLYPNVIEHTNYMTWDEVRALQDAGMEIGSHSKSHQYMTKQTPEEQQIEVQLSNSILEEKLGIEITTFAYPFGLYDSEIQNMLQDAGYTTARSLDTGSTHGPEDQYKLSSYLIRSDFFDFQYFVDQAR